ncbi:unnamed protein product [Calicophoron daubneyi]|uniref:Thioredoxin n=1 Tax=Calicophoron daubneyi TaxID=300641 RepID=A0AAV2T842_CALDB
MVSHVDKKEEVKKFIDEGKEKLVVLDFFATWCGPCRAIAPEVEELSKKYPNVKFGKVDVDVDEECSSEYKIECMPTFVFFKEGKEIERFSGADSAKLKAVIEKYAN